MTSSQIPLNRVILAIARRYVADRCLYGVDINPMAVEMGKLSLWLITLQRDRPFTFLDHALKCGDSLLGVSSVQQIENFSLGPGDRQVTFATANLFRYVEEAGKKRRALEDLPSSDHTQIETKNRLHAEAEAATAKVKALADALIALELRGLDGDAYEEQRAIAADHAQVLLSGIADQEQALNRLLSSQEISTLAISLQPLAFRHRPFHWPVEFPEVFARGGFDAFVGNPPFIGGQRITGTLGTDYRDYLITHLANRKRGTADLCAYFFLRAYSFLRSARGFAGLLATSTIAQGDTREVGLDQISEPGGVIFRAVQSAPWPGNAALEVAHVWLTSGEWRSTPILNGFPVRGITPLLTEVTDVSGKPNKLAANSDKSFIGSYVMGLGFVLEPDEVKVLVEKNPANRDVLWPYLNGDDISSRFDQSPSRWVINFQDWPLDRAGQGSWMQATVNERAELLRSGHVPQDYPAKVASDYLDCLTIVTDRVKPQRLVQNDKYGRHYWWRFLRTRPELYSTVRPLSRFLVHPLTNKHHSLVFCSHGIVASHMTVVLPFDGWDSYALLQNDTHWQWVLAYGNKLETRPQYTPSDVLETFPFPVVDSSSATTLARLGELYYAHRGRITRDRKEGLTSTYNRFHDRGEQSEDIVRLRALHVEMDQAVALAYGWPILINGQVVNPPSSSLNTQPSTLNFPPLDLGHGFHPTKQGERYTLSEPARRTVLDRLLQLNHQRYEDEVKAGLHDKGRKRTKRGSTKTPASPSLDNTMRHVHRDLFA